MEENINKTNDNFGTFEESMKELEKIVQELERGSLPLDQALDAFKRGIDLSQHCQKQLNQAEELVAKVMTQAGLKDLDEVGQ